MLDPEWIAKLHVSGQTERTFEVLLEAGANDEVMSSIALLFLGILAGSGTGIDLVLQVQAESALRLLASNLDVRDGPLDTKYKGKATPIILSLRRICTKLIEKSSTRRLASLTLTSCLRQRLLPLVVGPLLQERMDLSVLSALAAEGRPLVARLDLYSKGLALMSKDDGVDLKHIQQCLETMAVLFADAQQDREDEAKYFDDVMGLFVIIMAATSDEDETVRQQALRCAILSLQPLVALASTRRQSSHLPSSAVMLGRLIISRDAMINSLRGRSQSPHDSSDQQIDLAVDDLMSFALAILLSMIDSPAAATAIATSRVSGCTNRLCINGCRCPSAEPLISILATLYSDDSAARGDNDLTQIYLHGYLAYIIARLLVSSRDEVQPLVEPLLPGSSWDDKVANVQDALMELRSTNSSTTRDGAEDVMASGESTDALLEAAIGELRSLRE